MTEGDPSVTRLLGELRDGDEAAADRLARLVYADLHAIAERALRRERDDHTLQATELVGEAFMRLVGVRETTFADRAHFYAVASSVIRRILVDHARRRRRVKRDHGVRVTLDDAVRDAGGEPLDVIALDDALRELEALSPRQGRVVELRYFAGLSIEQIADTLAISAATVKRDWTFARAFLLQSLSPDA
jgi:RNA polymerase sigma factor (TIGR02999 family)